MLSCNRDQTPAERAKLGIKDNLVCFSRGDWRFWRHIFMTSCSPWISRSVPGFALFLGFWSDLQELEWHSARKVGRWVEKEGCKQLLYWRQMVFSRKKKNSRQAQWEKLSSAGAWSSFIVGEWDQFSLMGHL
jgi:hypothetical protein